MLAKDGEKLQKGGVRKRRHPAEDGGRAEWKKKKNRGEEEKQGQKPRGDGGRKRLDALSVGYFRRVGERLSEGFEEDEERGEMDLVLVGETENKKLELHLEITYCDFFCVT